MYRDVLIENLRRLIADSVRRLESKIDAKGNPLTDTQLATLEMNLSSQYKRLEKLTKQAAKSATA